MNKTIKLLFFILLLPLIAFAEYNGHQIKFSVEFNDGGEIIGYSYLASIYQKDKSIGYKEFLETNYELILRNHYNDSIGEFTYFQNRIKYNYKDYDGEKRFIYTLTDKKEIDKQNIKKFKIIELTDQSYAIGISTNHNWKDRLWMKTKPTEKHSFGGTFCSHDIYIHEKNDDADKIIEDLKKISLNFEKAIKEQQEIMESSDGKYYYQAKERIEKIEEEIDSKISEVLQNFDGMKVVIISMCSC